MDEIFDGLSVYAVDDDRPTPASTRVSPKAAPGHRTSSHSGLRISPRLRKPVVAFAVSVVLVVPASLLVSSLTGKSDSARAAQTVASGLAAHHAARLPEAAALYRKAIRLDAQNKFAHYNLGLVAQTSGDRAVAEREYRIAMALDPRFTTPVFNLAIMRTEDGMLDEAADLYRGLISVEPKNAPAHLNLGFVLMRLGRDSDAGAEFEAAVRLDPKLAGRLPKKTR